MLHIREAVIVEGRYDKIKLSSLCDALIVETGGFGIYRDDEKRAFIRKLAEECGIILLTDSDAAGRQIRNYIASFVPKEQLRHAYIPDVPGKEKRKAAPSKEGKLGVEGVSAELVLRALQDAVDAADGNSASATDGDGEKFSAAELFALGLTGGKDSAARRKALYSLLGLPENLSTKQFLRWANTGNKREQILDAIEKTGKKA